MLHRITAPTRYSSALVVVPAAIPSMVTALQQVWAFTWRTLMTGEVLIPVAGTLGIGNKLDNAYSQQFF